MMAKKNYKRVIFIRLTFGFLFAITGVRTIQHRLAFVSNVTVSMGPNQREYSYTIIEFDVNRLSIG